MPDVRRRYQRLERTAGDADRRQILRDDPACRAAAKMFVDGGGLLSAHRFVDICAQQRLAGAAVHTRPAWALNARGGADMAPFRKARSFMRALCTCDFDVPSEMPSIVAIS